MLTLAALGAAHIPEILAAEGGRWWRRDEPYWLKCLEEQRLGHRNAIIAADESGVIGYAYLNWHSQYPRFRTRQIPEINDLRVADRRRRLGVATAMITHFEGVARRAGCTAIGIGVGMYGGYGAAQRLYAKLGFLPDGHGLTYGNADVQPGAMVTIDDGLLLWLVRDLAPPAARPEETPGVIVLGIETSCDETAAAVVERHADGGGRILSDIILSQISDHLAFGGVVPEIAARAHVEALDGVIAAAMREAGVGFDGLDGVAATAGPGLIGGVIVGLTTAKAIALAAAIKLAAVNHLEGHALTARLTDGLAFPYLLLLVSGGHTQFVAVEGVGRYQRIGTTIDDALGEAFDKAAKLLGLPYPGGPPIEAAAERGDGRRFALPRPLIGKPGADFSLSGLKTALRLAAEKVAPLSDKDVDDLAASFQAAVVDIIRDRAAHAMETFALSHGSASTGRSDVLVIAGGVAANQAIRTALAAAAGGHDFRLVAPPARLCADNGVMIAWAGAERLALGLSDPLDAPARARWPLAELAVDEAAS